MPDLLDDSMVEKNLFNTQLVPVNPENIELLQDICSTVYSANFEDHWNGEGLRDYLENQFGKKRLKIDLADQFSRYYFITSGGRIRGFLKLRLHTGIEGYLPDSTAELEKIYILPTDKGMGFGKSALQQIFQFLSLRKIHNLFLQVIDTNKSAIAFYEKLGFKKIGVDRLDEPNFKEELRGMYTMMIHL